MIVQDEKEFVLVIFEEKNTTGSGIRVLTINVCVKNLFASH